MNKNKIEQQISLLVKNHGNFENVIKRINTQNRIQNTVKKEKNANILYSLIGSMAFLAVASSLVVAFVVTNKNKQQHKTNPIPTSEPTNPHTIIPVRLAVPSFELNNQTYVYDKSVNQPISDNLKQNLITETEVYNSTTKETYHIKIYEVDGYLSNEKVGITVDLSNELYLYKINN